jgi:hypothetical protein
MFVLVANLYQHLSPGTESLSVITNTTQITLAKAKPRSFPEDIVSNRNHTRTSQTKKISTAAIAQTHVHWASRL